MVQSGIPVGLIVVAFACSITLPRASHAREPGPLDPDSLVAHALIHLGRGTVESRRLALVELEQAKTRSRDRPDILNGVARAYASLKEKPYYSEVIESIRAENERLVK